MKLLKTIEIINHSSLINNRGASLIVAIFMLVVFGVIGVGLVSMLTTSHETSSEDMVSIQAFFMAESGAEIKIFDTVKTGSVSPKSYSWGNYNITTAISSISDITENPKYSHYYNIKSKCTVMNIKREIEGKFLK